jgi:murein L,D-transpeptidase YafK
MPSFSSLRFVRRLAALALAAALLSGCVIGEGGDDRHLQPLPARLVADMSGKGMSQSDPILIRIFKRESELEVWKRDRSGRYALLKTYPMCRWSGKLGPKKQEGDRQAPEGFYTVTADLMNPRSQFYLSFNLGYPNTLERSLGYSGSALMVHGACTSSGCFALTDDGVTEIFGLAREAFAGGQRSFQVQALPFRMTADAMAQHRSDPNFAFWQNLKEGFDHFEATRQPPKLAFCGRRYVFDAKDGSGPFEAGAACPPYEIDPTLQPLISQRQDKEKARFAELVAGGVPAMSYAYLDGGMHSSFRTMLKSLGPERMQPMVAGKVEISRPDAALADPFAGDAPGRADVTGSLAKP